MSKTENIWRILMWIVLGVGIGWVLARLGFEIMGFSGGVYYYPTWLAVIPIGAFLMLLYYLSSRNK